MSKSGASGWRWAAITILMAASVACGGLGGQQSYEGDESGECADQADNDRDGQFDCLDDGCAASPLCASPATSTSPSAAPADLPGPAQSIPPAPKLAAGIVERSIRFVEPPGVISVHTLEAVRVPPTIVLDAEGRRVADAPIPTWRVSPPGVATVVNGQLFPTANGQALVTAEVGRSVVTFSFVVALPTHIEILGYDAASELQVGRPRQLTAVVWSDDTAVRGQRVRWSSDANDVATVDSDGRATGVAAGKATITATSGDLESSVEVTVDGW